MILDPLKVKTLKKKVVGTAATACSAYAVAGGNRAVT
jgi:hypothetical protein